MGVWGRLSGCFSQIKEIGRRPTLEGERVNEREREGGGQIALATLSYPTTSTSTPSGGIFEL